MSKKLVFIIILIISTLTLQLELLQTRILSVALWHHFVYIVITMALLGFAASGTALSVSSRLKRLSDSRFYFLCLTGFSLTSYFTTRFAYYPIRNIFALSPSLIIIFSLTITYTISMLPYFFAGLAIGGSFIRFSNITSILYFANLLGSGLGCILFILLIGYFGAPRLLLFSSLVCIIPLVPIIKNNKRIQILIIPWLIFLGIGLFLPEDSRFHQVLPECHKQFWTIFGKDTQLEYSKWNPISRIDVISDVNFPKDKHILMDGDAEAALYDVKSVREALETDLIDRNAAYVLMNKKPGRVLIIGAGGGVDVLMAALRGAREIDAVEINPTTAHLVSKRYASHLSYIFSYPNINLFIEDGRSFVKRSKKQYDIIMIPFTDSLAALSTGAYVLSDNYLYTREAFTDYLNHLSEDGFIQIKRWYYIEKPRETLRIFSTALKACRDNGYSNPVSNISVISPDDCADVIIKKKPFSRDEKERLSLFCSKHNIKIIFPVDISQAQKEQEAVSPFFVLANDFLKGTEKKFYKEYDYNVSPVSDDSPFFYQYNKFNFNLEKKFQHEYYDRIRGVWHIFVLASLLIHSTILSLILVLAPLVISKKYLGEFKNRFFIFIYFVSIGFAFMLLEMGIIQKFVLFLGNPIYSIAVVLPTILIFAGFGSLFSYQIKSNINLAIYIVTFVCGSLIFLMSYLISHISNLFLLQPSFVRIIAVIITVAPLAFFMGFPFPLAIKAISTYSRESIPWAWAINGASSVIASIIATIIAMQFGFKMVLNAAAIFYIIATLSSLCCLKRVIAN